MSKSGLDFFTCPRCKTLTVDNWPLDINGVIEDGGCQECWEDACEKDWVTAMTIFDEVHTKKDKDNE